MSTLPTIRLHDKTFRLAIPHAELAEAIRGVAERINHDYAGLQCPLFLGVLNGSFMFMSELLQHIEFDCETSFIKLSSYSGTCTSGSVKELIGMSGSVRGRHIIIVEDIVDTGCSINFTIQKLMEQEPASIAVATLLFKPEAYKGSHEIKYPAMSIPDKFIVGFGLDYDQLGRNLKDIYEVVGL